MAKTREHDFLTDFGKRLAELRNKKGITQEALAGDAGLHRTYIGFIEQGKRDPTIGNIYRIAKALGVSPKELFEPFDTI